MSHFWAIFSDLTRIVCIIYLVCCLLGPGYITFSANFVTIPFHTIESVVVVVYYLMLYFEVREDATEHSKNPRWSDYHKSLSFFIL